MPFCRSSSGYRSFAVLPSEYYFSEKNLQTDYYLKSTMDEEGFAPLAVVANFPKVVRLQTTPDVVSRRLLCPLTRDVHVDVDVVILCGWM